MKLSVRRGLTIGGCLFAGATLFTLSHVILLDSKASPSGLIAVRLIDGVAFVLVLAGVVGAVWPVVRRDHI